MTSLDLTPFSDSNLADLIAWVEAAYPVEGCGLILQKPDGSFEVLRCDNLADKYHAIDPETYPRTARTFYMINPMEFVRAERRGDRVAVVFHSHADVGAYFSAEDVAGALMPRDNPDDPIEPAHPGVDYLVVSVREGGADGAILYRFDPDARGFIAALEIGVEGGAYSLSSR